MDSGPVRTVWSNVGPEIFGIIHITRDPQAKVWAMHRRCPKTKTTCSQVEKLIEDTGCPLAP